MLEFIDNRLLQVGRTRCLEAFPQASLENLSAIFKATEKSTMSIWSAKQIY